MVAGTAGSSMPAPPTSAGERLSISPRDAVTSSRTPPPTADVAGSVVGFGPEDGSHLEHPLVDADHDLLVELRALRQVGGSAEIVDPEHVGAALRGRPNQLRCLYLD